MKIDYVGHTYIKRKGKNYYKKFGHTVSINNQNWFYPEIELMDGDTLKYTWSYTAKLREEGQNVILYKK